MKTSVIKVFWNFEKEEEWLNDMSAKGLALTDYFWLRYVFQDCAPGEYIYRIEMLKHLASHPESKKYIEFIEETGAEHVSSYLKWVYFRKKAVEGSFDIYSDIDSRISHYMRIIKLFGIVAAFNLGAWIMNMIAGLLILSHNRIVSPNLWISLINLFIACLLGFLCVKFLSKAQKLKKVKTVRQ